MRRKYNSLWSEFSSMFGEESLLVVLHRVLQFIQSLCSPISSFTLFPQYAQTIRIEIREIVYAQAHIEPQIRFKKPTRSGMMICKLFLIVMVMKIMKGIQRRPHSITMSQAKVINYLHAPTRQCLVSHFRQCPQSLIQRIPTSSYFRNGNYPTHVLWPTLTVHQCPLCCPIQRNYLA